MSANYTDYSQYSTKTVFVSNTSELNSAVRELASDGGGTIKVDPNGGPYDLNVSGVGSSNAPVLIESAGSREPLFESMTIQNSQYIAITGMRLDTSHMNNRSKWDDDLRIAESSNIEFVDNTLIGNAEGYLSEGGGGTPASGTQGARGAYITDSKNILISDNLFTNHYQPFKITDTVGLEFTENEVTKFQADGFQGNGLQNTKITHNHIHNPYGSTESIVHSDFIQIFMKSADLSNRNIEIAHNLLDTGDGPAAQGIWMGTGGASGTNYNISVHNNVIHSAVPNGIGIHAANGLDVYNNTLLWNQDSFVEHRPGSELKSWQPQIVTSGRNIELSDNVAPSMTVNGSRDDDGGYRIQYNNPSASNHVDKHVTNLDGPGNSYDLTFLSSSPIYGKYGAEMSSQGTITRFASEDPAPSARIENAPLVEDTVAPEPAPQADAAAAQTPAPSSSNSDVTLYLVDTISDETIAVLSDGAQFGPELLDNKDLTVVAEVPDDIGRVHLSLGDWTRVENVKPYALFADRNGDLNSAREAPFATEGEYEVTVELFSWQKGWVKTGESTVGFSVGADGDTASSGVSPEVILPDFFPAEDDTPVINEDVEPTTQPTVEPIAARLAPEPVVVTTAEDDQDDADEDVSTVEDAGASTSISRLFSMVFGFLEGDRQNTVTLASEINAEVQSFRDVRGDRSDRPGCSDHRRSRTKFGR